MNRKETTPFAHTQTIVTITSESARELEKSSTIQHPFVLLKMINIPHIKLCWFPFSYRPSMDYVLNYHSKR